MTKLEILTEARRLLVDVGWTQGQSRAFRMGDVTGYCATGALAEATRNLHKEPSWQQELSNAAHSNYHGALAALNDGVRARTQNLHAEVVPWNDTTGRTKAEVLDLFDAAIAATGETK